ncbi:enoyl-CoA hydratase-related protein [Cupriavidus taiwanensis]|uniref:enoyl-CoA hydratase-related protein n=1 Tax=Cupriavidus taiwanensis TaxID=164546 RepID=UPI000E119443|nr:enoyl-CoA hydratase-related protein [Cupriavidus taiwanensis]SOZ33495.1 acyl-CoA hydratase [Cupriavidus taiwanensis]SPA25476.1 acyl-CoA hydratase [Cupriavidus taiwanensis]
MTYRNIKVTANAAVARITLSRPDKLNSLDEATMIELHSAVDSIANDPTFRVMAIAGEGRAFCAGQDLADPAMQTVGSTPPDIGTHVERYFKPLVLKLQSLPMPTVAAVHGLAAGGGASLALACDVVVAAKSAYFLQAFSKIGLTPDTGSTWFLTHRVGIARAMGLALFADKLPAEKAAEWGLIWQAIEDADFSASIEALLERLASMPTKAMVRTRQLMLAAAVHSLEEQLSMEATFIRELGWRQDYQEGVRAFTEKRQPDFRGN